MKDNKLVIKDWTDGITNSPMSGVCRLENIDISSEQGIAQLNFRLRQFGEKPVTTTFTADSSTDIITTGSSFIGEIGNGGGRAVLLTTTGTLPAPLATGTVYYLIGVTSTTYKLATSLRDSDTLTEINITTTGTGTHTITSLDVGLPKHYAEDKRTNDLYVLDHTGRLWGMFNNYPRLITTGNTRTNANGNGLAIWNNYLFVFRNRDIDVWGPMTDAYWIRTWTNGWQSCNQEIGDNYTHKTCIMENNILYFLDRVLSSNDNYVGSITQIGVFNPASSGTYTFNNQALDLPKYEELTDLCNYGNLMISTTGYNIYPWDTISPSFDTPIVSAEKNIRAMSVLNNILYYSAGVTGNVYATQGTSNTISVINFPEYISQADQYQFIVSYMIPHKNGLLFSGYSGGVLQGIKVAGVWFIDLSGERPKLTLRNTYSLDETLQFTQIQPGALYSYGTEDYLAGWFHSYFIGVDFYQIYGIDRLMNFPLQRSIQYKGVIETRFYEVGSSVYPKTFHRIEINLAQPLQLGHGLKIYYRKNLSESFTLINTYDWTTQGVLLSSFDDIPNIIDTQNVQLRIEMQASNNDFGSQYLTTPKLESIILE
jgi:hypothetical protein